MPLEISPAYNIPRYQEAARYGMCSTLAHGACTCPGRTMRAFVTGSRRSPTEHFDDVGTGTLFRSLSFLAEHRRGTHHVPRRERRSLLSLGYMNRQGADGIERG